MHDIILSVATRSTGDPDWVIYNNDLLFHAPLYTKGIIAVKPIDESCNSVINEQCFKIKDKTFSIQQITPTVDPSQGALSVSQNNAQSKSAVPASAVKTSSTEADARCVDKTAMLLNKITRSNVYFDFLVFNVHDKEEVFLPFAQNGRGFYVLPWLSEETNAWEFTGFEQFVTTGYLFDADFIARDNLDRKFPLIKRAIDFYKDEYIASIIINTRKPSPFLEIFIVEFEKICDLINRFSNESKPKKLLFHLPYLDYVLFGIELYLHKKISISAFERLIDVIFIKKHQYAERIKQVCQKHNIEVTIASPFDNLFDSSVTNDKAAQSPHDIISKFLDFLGLQPTAEAQESAKITTNPAQLEAHFVKHCLATLCKSNVNLNHAKVWCTLLSAIPVDSIKTVDELLKIANAAFIAIAADGKPDYKTCSVLPLTEKQTQVSYSKYCKESNLQTQLSGVVNLTILDSFLTYSPATNGQLSYFHSYQESILKMIQNTQLMKHASQTVASFVRYQTTLIANTNAGSSRPISPPSTSLPIPSIFPLPTNSHPPSLTEQQSLNTADHQDRKLPAHSYSDEGRSNFLLFKEAPGVTNESAPVKKPPSVLKPS